MKNEKMLREQLLELLRGGSAHISVDEAISAFPVAAMNSRPANSPHSAWELIEHMRIAQWDILEFSRDPQHVSPEFPEGYWPKHEGTAEDWQRSAAQVSSDLRQMCDLVSDERTDLFKAIPHGSGQTILREALLAADHNAYHLGQLMLVKKMLGPE